MTSSLDLFGKLNSDERRRGRQFKRIDNALNRGFRGLPRGSPLAKLLAEKRPAKFGKPKSLQK